MQTPFTQTLRSLNMGSRRRRTIQILLAVILIGVWIAWLIAADLPIVAVSRRARATTAHTTYEVRAQIPGVVVVANAPLGRIVGRGDVLAEMDSRTDVLIRGRLTSEAENLQKRSSVLAAQIEATRALAAAQERTLQTRVREAHESTLEAEQLTTIATAHAERQRQLYGDALVSRADIDDAQNRAEAERARVRRLRVAEDLVRNEADQSRASTLARIRELDNLRLEVDALLSAARSGVQQADIQIDRFSVRAPITGRISASAIEAVPGRRLNAGETLCSISPLQSGEVAAWFSPDTMSFIQPGQHASVWFNHPEPGGRYLVEAAVSAVEKGAGDGDFRVLVSLAGDAASRALPESGIPAVVVVEIQRLSPLRALLRAAGLVRIENPS